MIWAMAALVFGMAVLLWSADRLVKGAASVARHLHVPPLLIGMVIIGLGTSSPEIVVAILAASQGTPGIVIGNAYGASIANIAFILGVAAIISPIAVRSQVLRRELPLLLIVTGLAAWQIYDGHISRLDALILLVSFVLIMGWIIRQSLKARDDTLSRDVKDELEEHPMTLGSAVFWLVVGLVLLVASGHVLVWGAVEVARALGVSELMIGLTIMSIGTTLPELASSVFAARRGESEIALGNVLGSNIFNILVVVGLASMIHPIRVAAEVFSRDMMLLAGLTTLLFFICLGLREEDGQISRLKGAFLLSIYVSYITYLVISALR